MGSEVGEEEEERTRRGKQTFRDSGRCLLEAYKKTKWIDDGVASLCSIVDPAHTGGQAGRRID